MAKKYLSLDEAAAQLGIAPDQLMRHREQGEIRGFADRGSWKFREQDVEEFLRARSTDSSPDFPIIRDDSSSSVLDDADDEKDLSSSDSDVRLFFDDSLFGEGDAKQLADSGSDVKLTGDSGPALEADAQDDALDLSGWDSNVKLSDSDSDVKLVGAATEPEVDLASTSMLEDSDSDVLLADDSGIQFAESEDDSGITLSGTDSDVRLGDAEELDKTTAFTGIDSDSDVKLMGSDDLLAEDSDSDVKLGSGLDRTDSDIRLAEDDSKTMAIPAIPDDSDLKLIRKGSGVRQPLDSGISLDVRGSGIGLDADESGISLEIDSGISLDADDSGISLESFDSGAKLGDDSGISLDAGDSGISLDLDDDSGISMSLDDEEDMSKTMPMKAIPAARALMDSTAHTTQLEMPSQGVGRDSEFELAGLDDDDEDVGASTSVLTFEDDESGSAQTVAAPAVEDEEYEESYDDDGGLEDEFADEELDGVHDADEFDDEFESGQSQIGLQPGTRAVMVRDVDWGTPVKVMLWLSTAASLGCAVVGIELVRTMWLFTQPDAEPSGILSMIGGLFGG